MKRLILISLLIASLGSCTVGTFQIVSAVDPEPDDKLILIEATGKGLTLDRAVKNCLDNVPGGKYMKSVTFKQGLFRYKVIGQVYGS